MPILPLSTLVTDLRTLSHDKSSSNPITLEPPVGAVNGVNVNFRLQNLNIVDKSVYVTLGPVFRTQSGFTVDNPNGILTFSAAPISGSALTVDYFFQYFADMNYVEFLTEAARSLSYTDPEDVVLGLVPALLQYALYQFYVRRSTQYAHRYASSGGMAGQQVETVTGNFLNLAKQAMKMGIQLRDDFYKRQGQRLAPASIIKTYGVDPMTPIR